MNAEILLSSLPIITHMHHNMCHVHYHLQREPCRKTGIVFPYVGFFLPSIPQTILMPQEPANLFQLSFSASIVLLSL